MHDLFYGELATDLAWKEDTYEELEANSKTSVTTFFCFEAFSFAL